MSHFRAALARQDVSAGGSLRPHRRGWNLAGLSGRLVELAGAEDSAALTLAFSLVREAQLTGEPVAWVTLVSQSFFPPDAAAGGVDLDALAVVRVSRPRDLTRAADTLARSGAFGLIVLDLGDRRTVALPIQSRLRGLAARHDLALLFLTQKAAGAPSLGSLISLRAQATRKQTGFDEFSCELKVLKDKRAAPGWGYREVCRGPAGLH